MKRLETPRPPRLPACPRPRSIRRRSCSVTVRLKRGRRSRSGKAQAQEDRRRVRARRRASVEPDQPGAQPATPLGKKRPLHSSDPIDDVTRELITKCAGPKAEWRTLDRMSSTTRLAKTAINEALPRLGEAVKTREATGTSSI